MRSTASNQSNWQSTTIFMAVLLGATVVMAPVASGCNNDVISSPRCPDAGMSDGGDAGDGGAGGHDPYCI